MRPPALTLLSLLVALPALAEAPPEWALMLAAGATPPEPAAR